MRVNNWVSLLVFIGALVYFLRVKGPQEHVRLDDDGTVHVVTEDGTPIEGYPPFTPKRRDGQPPTDAGSTMDDSAGAEKK